MIYLWFLTHMLSKSHLNLLQANLQTWSRKSIKDEREMRNTLRKKRVNFNIVTAKVKRKHYKWGNSLCLIEMHQFKRVKLFIWQQG